MEGIKIIKKHPSLLSSTVYHRAVKYEVCDKDIHITWPYPMPYHQCRNTLCYKMGITERVIEIYNIE